MDAPSIPSDSSQSLLPSATKDEFSHLQERTAVTKAIKLGSFFYALFTLEILIIALTTTFLALIGAIPLLLISFYAIRIEVRIDQAENEKQQAEIIREYLVIREIIYWIASVSILPIIGSLIVLLSSPETPMSTLSHTLPPLLLFLSTLPQSLYCLHASTSENILRAVGRGQIILGSNRY